jgi:hypothetical protein
MARILGVMSFTKAACEVLKKAKEPLGVNARSKRQKKGVKK